MNGIWNQFIKWISGITMVIDGLSIFLTLGFFHFGLTGYLRLLVPDEDPEADDWLDVRQMTREDEIVREQAMCLLQMGDAARMEHLANLRANPSTLVLVPRILEWMEELRDHVHLIKNKDAGTA